MNYFLHNDPNLPQAWSPWFSHEYIAYYAVGAVEGLADLPKVSVRANPRLAEKIWPAGPKHIDVYKESYQEHRQLDPLWSFDYKKRNGDFALDVPPAKTIEPWKVLVLYSTEPDLYLDHDLNLHKNQPIMGGSHGWRHMQFKLLGTTYGIVPQSFRVHKNFAQLAFDNGNDYWGWRYLSRASHYLADLGQPFHVKALPGFYLIRKIRARDELFQTVSAIHQSHEVYVERRFREGFKPFGEALIHGAREGQAAGWDVQAELNGYIKRARKRHNPIFYHLLNQFGRELLDAFNQMDPHSQIDAAEQINRCSADAARVLFKKENLSKLDFLDRITVEILDDVGRMLGMLFREFLPQKK